MQDVICPLCHADLGVVEQGAVIDTFIAHLPVCPVAHPVAG